MTSTPRCFCRCHAAPGGAFLADALEAAVACESCRNAHTVALSDSVTQGSDYGEPKPWTPGNDRNDDGDE